MCARSKFLTLELSHDASGREYLNDAPSCGGKKIDGTPLYSTASRVSDKPSVVESKTTSIPCCMSARHIGTIAVAGPPDRCATDGMTCKTLMVILDRMYRIFAGLTCKSGFHLVN